MAVLEELSEEEMYLWSILSDPSGVDQAEFLWEDHTTDTGLFRLWPFQHSWYRCEGALQIDQSSRSCGKSLSIRLRACAFPLLHPGQELLIAAPELTHLKPVITYVEQQIMQTRLLRELLPKGRNNGITHKLFEVNFLNGAKIEGRIPQRDGRGMKGAHPLWLEIDEAQDFPEPGWTEVIETLKRGHEGAAWRCVAAGQLVLTSRGWIPIEDIVVGDSVFTHKQRWRPVLRIFDNGEQECVKVNGNGHPGLVVTPTHKFYVREVLPRRKHLGKKSLGAPGWTPVQDFARAAPYTHWASPGMAADWVFGLGVKERQVILDGMAYGDASWSENRSRWEYSTVSKELALGVKLLGQSLGYVCNLSKKPPRDSVIEGRTVKTSECWIVQMTKYEDFYAPRSLILDDGLVWAPVEDGVEKVGSRHVYDLEVAEDHSYTLEGIIVSNCHGVTKGVRDYFYKFTQPDSGWMVHRITAMSRPTWTDEERKEKIEMYGSRDHPDYRRNVLGLHGDASNPLFVLHRLMQCVDQDQDSDYNTLDYQNFRINAELLIDRGGDIVESLQFPVNHKTKWKTFWAGMDVGYTNHPSEIVIFAEEQQRGKDPLFRLVSRIHLERIAHQDQVAAILHVMRWYNVKAFAMDKTGLGLPLFQDIQSHAPGDAGRIKGYGFAEKILVDFDTTIELDEYKGDLVKDAGMWRSVLEYSSDKLRDLVDTNRLRLPWDRDIIGEFQGQTYVVLRDTTNLYGKKSYSKGSYHTLDACKMATLGMVQNAIEEFTKKEAFEPAPTIIFGD